MINYLQDDEIFSVFAGEFVQPWGDHLAWTAPCGKEVDHDQFAASHFDLFIEVLLLTINTKQ